MQWLVIFKLVVLLTVANGTPVLAAKLFGKYLNQPLDCGVTFVDGRPVFGDAKTIRGIIFSLMAATITAPALGFAWTCGLIVASVAMSGDLKLLEAAIKLAAKQPRDRNRSNSRMFAPDYGDPFNPWSGRFRCRFGSDHILLRASHSLSTVFPMEHPKSSLLTHARPTEAMERNFRGAIEPDGNDG